MATADDDDYEYDGYLLYNEICFSKNVGDQNLTKIPSVAEDYLLENKLQRFESGSSRDKGEGFEPSDIRNHTRKLPSETAEFINSLISLHHRSEKFESTEAEVEPDEPRQIVKIPNESSVDVFWKAPDFVYIRGPDGAASTARDELNSHLGSAASIRERRLNSDFLLWLFKRIYEGENISDVLSVDRLTDAKVEGAEDILGKENTVKESKDALRAPTILIGLLLGKSLTMMEGDFALSTNDEEVGEVTARVEIARDKIQIKSSKSGFGNKSGIEKVGYSTQIVHEIVTQYRDWKKADNSDKLVPPPFFGQLLIDSHDNDIDLKDTGTILEVLGQQANRRNENLSDYDDETLDEAIELLSEE